MVVQAHSAVVTWVYVLLQHLIILLSVLVEVDVMVPCRQRYEIQISLIQCPHLLYNITHAVFLSKQMANSGINYMTSRVIAFIVAVNLTYSDKEGALCFHQAMSSSDNPPFTENGAPTE